MVDRGCWSQVREAISHHLDAGERYADAVEAAREWRDEMREVVGAVPRKGDKLHIVWPGGPRNFDMEFIRLREDLGANPPGWFWLVGIVDYRKPLLHTGPTPIVQTLYARHVSPGHYEMVAKPR